MIVKDSQEKEFFIKNNGVNILKDGRWRRTFILGNFDCEEDVKETIRITTKNGKIEKMEAQIDNQFENIDIEILDEMDSDEAGNLIIDFI